MRLWVGARKWEMTKVVSWLVIGAATLTVASGLSTTCMMSLSRNRSILDVCLTEACILFRDNSLNIELGAPPYPETDVPFLCKQRRTLFPSLDGIQLKLLYEIPELDSAYCVFAKGCTTNDVVEVLERAARIGNYHFIAADYLFILPTRISPAAVPSVPIFGSTMVVAGKAPPPRSDMAVIKAFTWGSWILAISLFVALVAIRVWLVIQLLPTHKDKTRREKWRDRWWCFWGEHRRVPQLQVQIQENSREESLLFWCRRWTQVMTTVVAIFVILYEIGLVTAMFKNAAVFTLPIKDLSENRLREFVVKRQSAQENTLQQLADPSGKYAGNKTKPWHTVENLDDAFDMIRDPSHPAKSVLTYTHYVQYILQKQGACKQFAIFQTQDADPTFNSCLYYGIGIPESQRIAINRRIAMLVKSQDVNDILNTKAPKSKCGETTEGPIPAIVLAETILVIGGTFILFAVIALIRDLVLRRGHPLPLV